VSHERTETPGQPPNKTAQPGQTQGPKLPPRKPVRLAKPQDLEFVIDLTKKNSNALGFIPQEAVEWYIQNHLVNLVDENGDAAGFILAKHAQPDAPGITSIHQACICYDARRRQAGLALVNRVKAIGAAHGNGVMQLWCRGELDANEFWQAAGFEAVGLRAGGSRRNIPHILWRHALMRGANLTAPPSSRRRTRAGIPVMRPAEISTRDIVNNAHAGGLLKLLADWTQRAHIVLPADCSDAPADFTDGSLDLEDVPADLTATGAPTPRTSVNASCTPSADFRTTSADLSTPLGRRLLSTPRRTPPTGGNRHASARTD